MEIASAVQLLDTSPSGLSPQQASSRIACIGPNRMAAPHGRPIWRMVVDHLLSLPALMLTVAAGLSLATGALLDVRRWPAPVVALSRKFPDSLVGTH